MKNTEYMNRSSDETKLQRLCLFRLDEDFYALPANVVQVIRPYKVFTFVPGCPPFILGIIHLKGQIEAVADLRVLLGKQGRSPIKGDHILMICHDRVRVGLLVDSAEDIIDVASAEIGKVPSGIPEKIQALLQGAVTKKGSTILLLDSELLVNQVQGAVK